ncbi:MAG: hypothetical protein M9953_13500 [Thermomicrobiales bacterium]|nr:hypothetical protein [Thermomicrobiales bacterium]
MASLRVDEQSAARSEAMPAKIERPQLTGIVGDQSAAAGESRSGEDARRRGWYWNWNTMVTQFAPLIGLDGKGLLDSYIVWTDRREESPFRGYAFPSTTAEANFYGIDRNVLGTINKILVTLDLIEIKKSMVHRPDESGNDWKFPHNTYRVKDQGDNFELTADAVRRVVQLAVEDQAVYRRIKHIFGSKFKPIDPQSVWYGIIAELEPTPNWQKLKALALADEQRTSERSRKGHAARRKSDDAETPATIGTQRKPALTTVPESSTVSTVPPAINDRLIDSTVASEMADKSTAASTSNGLETSAAQSSNASGVQASSDAALISTGQPTIAQSTSTMYYEHQTTTTTGDYSAQNRPVTTNIQQSQLGDVFGDGPDDSRDRELALLLFDEANEKPQTVATRKVLAKIAVDFADLATTYAINGWKLVGFAIEEAVSSGSSFVAPKRVREILNRWRKDGVPELYAGVSGGHDQSAQTAIPAVTGMEGGSHRFVRTADVGVQPVWQETLSLLAGDASISAALHAQLETDAMLERIEGDSAWLRVSPRLNAILLPDVQRAIQLKINVVVRRPLFLRVVTGGTEPSTVTRKLVESVSVSAVEGAFDIPGTKLNSDQLWRAVIQTLGGGGDIPSGELAALADSGRLLAFQGDTFVLGFGSAFHRRRAEHRRAALEREFAFVAGFTCRVEFVETDGWLATQQQRRA